MARLNVPPTKSNLLRLRRDLDFAREGFDMLDQKRQILILELMGTVESAKRIQQEVQERMAAAFTALRNALIRVGALKMSLDATAARPDHWAEVENRPLMGIYLPRVSAEHPEPGPVARREPEPETCQGNRPSEGWAACPPPVCSAGSES